MPDLQLWPEPPHETDGQITLGATIETPAGERQLLWYRVPAQFHRQLTASSDPFVLGVLFKAMRAGLNLRVHGQASPSLLRNLEEYQAAWTVWRPDKYTKINITADTEQENNLPPGDEVAVVAFSGGVDSCFTTWRHRTGQCGRWQRNLRAGMMVHGFDIPLDQPDVFARAAANSQKMLDSLGMELLPIATNFRDLGDDWEDCHAAAIVSCLMVFQGGYAVGVVGSTGAYDYVYLPWGSNPVTDWLLSSRSFQLVYDGAAYTRVQKVAAIAQWPEARKYLRVCWQGQDKAKNCSQCEKCIRTILNFRVAGSALPECFEQDVSNAQLAGFSHLKETQILEFEDILSAAKAANISADWVDVLGKTVSKNKAKPRRLQRIFYKGMTRWRGWLAGLINPVKG